jgi:hypothetical protein
MSKAIGATEINDLEAEIGKSIHQLKRAGTAPPHQESVTAKNSGDDLEILFRQMTERSTRELENLIDELHSLRKKLENDGDLIERAIEQHSQFSEGAMQLTMMIADNVKRLPHPTS